MMDEKRIPVSEVLTTDEQILADFLKTRMKKVQEDIQRLSDTGNESEAAWTEAFAYMIRTYGRDSQEPFRWYKYYLREGKIPASAALPLLVQIYMDSSVDDGFVNILARVMKNEPEDVKAARWEEMKSELAPFMDERGRVIFYRGSFEKPFKTEQDASRVIEKAYNFTMDEAVALTYAGAWYPEKATLYKVAAELQDIAWYSIYDEEKRAMLLPLFKGGSFEILEERAVRPEDCDLKMDEVKARRAYMNTFKNK